MLPGFVLSAVNKGLSPLPQLPHILQVCRFPMIYPAISIRSLPVPVRSWEGITNHHRPGGSGCSFRAGTSRYANAAATTVVSTMRSARPSIAALPPTHCSENAPALVHQPWANYSDVSDLTGKLRGVVENNWAVTCGMLGLGGVLRE